MGRAAYLQSPKIRRGGRATTDVLHAYKRQIPTLGLSSHRLSSIYLRIRIRLIFLREREDIHVTVGTSQPCGNGV
eukprot:2371326-Prymnesium_polylepis.1